MGLGTGELVLIFLAILLVFGAKRIPEIARGMGQGIREFREATNNIKRELTIEEDRRPSKRGAPHAANPAVSTGSDAANTGDASPSAEAGVEP